LTGTQIDTSNGAGGVLTAVPDLYQPAGAVGQETDRKDVNRTLMWRSAILNRLAWAFEGLVKAGPANDGAFNVATAIPNLCQMRLHFYEDGRVSMIEIGLGSESPDLRRTAAHYLGTLGSDRISHSRTDAPGGMLTARF
jgi:hypothetical protein